MKYIKTFENLDIQDKRLWKNIFEYKGSSYRLRSWKYIYRLSDGTSEFATVDKKDANGVSGTGVAGIVIELDKIKWSDRVTSYSDEFIEDEEKANKSRIEKEKDKYEFLKMLPPNLNRDEYDDIVINNAVGDFEEVEKIIDRSIMRQKSDKYNI